MSQLFEKIGVEMFVIELLFKLGYIYLLGYVMKVEYCYFVLVFEDVLWFWLLVLNLWLVMVFGGVDVVLIELCKWVNDELFLVNKVFWEQVVYCLDIQVKDVEGKLCSVCVFDVGKVVYNDFYVVDQYVGRNVDGDLFWLDLLLFVNGLLLVIIECKVSYYWLDEVLV